MRMSSIVYRGNLEGGSALLAGGLYRGEVWYSIRVYQDTLRNMIVAGGTLWGDDLVLRHAAVGQNVTLQLEDGKSVNVVVQRKSTDKNYLCIGVDGAISGL